MSPPDERAVQRVCARKLAARVGMDAVESGQRARVAYAAARIPTRC